MKSIITQIMVFSMASLMLISCNSNNAKTAYTCPMHCQQDTVYTNVGACPVCGMDMEKTTEIDSSKTTIINNTK